VNIHDIPTPEGPMLGTLLIVEDDESTFRALRVLFQHKGWKGTIHAADIATAKVSLDRRPAPECVILDLMLPDGNGEEILRKIRDENLPTRVVIYSGIEDDERLKIIHSLHPDAFVRKPTIYDDLMGAVGGPGKDPGPAEKGTAAP
jgi:DNA-binding NarL/FixJ family response regulator